MRIWEVLIKESDEFKELCCTLSYRYANKTYRKNDNNNKYLVYTDVSGNTNLTEFQKRGRIDERTIIFKTNSKC